MHHFSVTQYPHGYGMMYLYCPTATGSTGTVRTGGGRGAVMEVVMMFVVTIATNATRVDTKTRYILSFR